MISNIYINKFLMFLIFLTSSFDIFLNVNIYSFNIRFFYIILIISFLINFSRCQFKIHFIGVKYFLCWFFILLLFIFNTQFIYRNIGYMLWLILSILVIYQIYQIIKSNESTFFRIFDYYILSFTVLSCIGIMQFFLGLWNINFFIMQYWENTPIPRVNGFSYEPSYYGTYLSIGWFCLLYFYFNNRIIFSKYRIDFLLITVSMILSSSRMTIFFMFSFFNILFFKSLFLDGIKGKIKKNDIFILMIYLISFILIMGFILFFDLEKILFLLNGTGLFGTSSHSASMRGSDALYTLETFLNSPFIRYSLGGVATAIAEIQGIVVNSQAEAKLYEGMNIFLEILAASGIFGFLFFILWLKRLFKVSKKVSYICKEDTISFIILALRFSLIGELMLLMFNQNILRPYLWVLIGMLNVSIFVGITHNRGKKL